MAERSVRLNRQTLSLIRTSMILSVIIVTGLMVWTVGDLGWLIGSMVALGDWFAYRFLAKQVSDKDEAGY